MSDAKPGRKIRLFSSHFSLKMEENNPDFHVLDRLRLDLAKEDRVKAIHSTKDRRRTAMAENTWFSSFSKHLVVPAWMFQARQAIFIYIYILERSLS